MIKFLIVAALCLSGCTYKIEKELKQCKESLALQKIALAKQSEECVGYLQISNETAEECIETLVVCYDKLEGKK